MILRILILCLLFFNASVYADALDGVTDNNKGTELNADVNALQPLYLDPLSGSDEDVIQRMDDTWQKPVQQPAKVAPIESEQSFWQKLFTKGHYGVQGVSGYININKEATFVYGSNLSAQSGVINGFNAGAVYNVINPLLDNVAYNRGDVSMHNQFLPYSKVVGFQNLYANYNKNGNIAQAGWINLNTPWVTSYGTPFMQVQPAFQGLNLAYVTANRQVLLEGFGFNGFRSVSNNAFTGQTLYNKDYANKTQTPLLGSQDTPGAYGVGIKYQNLGRNTSLELWEYSFINYANMLYFASANKMMLSNEFGFAVNLQGVLQWNNGGANNLMIQNGYASKIGSSMYGVQLDTQFNKILDVFLSFNQVASAFGGDFMHGNMVSPYTNQYVDDPMFTTPIKEGLVELGAGNALAVSATVKLLSDKLHLKPRYVYFNTLGNIPAKETDVIFTYNASKRWSLGGNYTYAVEPKIEGGKIYNYYRVVTQYNI